MKLIRQLQFILSPREQVEGIALLCAMALGALFEVVGIGLVVPFIAVLKDPALVLDQPLARPILSALSLRDPHRLLIALGLGLIAAFVIKSSYLLLLNRWQCRYVFDKQATLARQLLTGYLAAPYTFHLGRNSAETIRVTIGTIQAFTSGFLLSLLTVLGELLVVAALVILLVLVNPLTTLCAVFVLGVPTVFVYRAIRRRLAVAGRISQESMASAIQWTEQAIGGVKETLITGRASFFIDRQGKQVRRLADAGAASAFLSALPRLLMDTLAVIAMVAMALMALVLGQDMQSLLPVLGMFAVAAIRLMPSATRIASGLAQLRFLHAATEVLYDELRAVGTSTPAPRAVRQTASLPLRFQHSLMLEQISYRYPTMSGPAIDAVSLEVRQGEWVGLVGPTGAGKTTLVDLILGLFVPTAGRILVDGRDIREDIASWQRIIGYIPQDIYLLDDTIRRNVAFGLVDEEIDDDRVWRALRAAQIDRLVSALPGGLDAMTGERGERLSGGERQRLGIARALYRDPQVLVVDEGTANLDNETEAAIVETLARLRGEKTIIVIAHRLSVVKDCDRVYLIRQGRVRHSGPLSDLFAAEPGLREFAAGGL